MTKQSRQQKEIALLFEEIEINGQVSANEMAAILPFSAGAAKKDILDAMSEMKAKNISLQKTQFVRYILKRFYGNWNAHTQCEENTPIAHVIMSMQRRTHLKKFADFCLSREVAGAELVQPIIIKPKPKVKLLKRVSVVQNGDSTGAFQKQNARRDRKFDFIVSSLRNFQLPQLKVRFCFDSFM